MRLTVPAEIVWHGDTPLVTFSTIAAADLDLPFLSDALARGRVSHFTPLDRLDRDDGELQLAGGIHHLTRCGSTLVRRQFDALPRVIALSEPFVFQHLLEGPMAPPETTHRRLRQLLAAWRDALAPIADRLVVKWPSLVAQHAATLAAALPDVPMIFLHRNATEILASIAADPLGGLQNLREHHLGQPLPADEIEAWATMLARTCRIAAGTPNMRTLDYAALPAASWTHVAPYFGLRADETAMASVATTHSKHRRPFAPDGPARRATTDARVRRAATILAPAIAELLARTPPLSSTPDSVHEPVEAQD